MLNIETVRNLTLKAQKSDFEERYALLLKGIEDSILEVNQGVVIASGQDDQGSALFIGGMKIDADTGELSGPPFEQAVNRIATRTAIARSF